MAIMPDIVLSTSYAFIHLTHNTYKAGTFFWLVFGFF